MKEKIVKSCYIELKHFNLNGENVMASILNPTKFSFRKS